MGVRIPEDAAIDTKEKKRRLWGRFSRHFIQVRSIRFCQYGLKKKMILVELVAKFKRYCTRHLLGCGSID
jgi:hypothetical protein